MPRCPSLIALALVLCGVGSTLPAPAAVQTPSVFVARVRFSSDAITASREALALTRAVEAQVSGAALELYSEIDQLQGLEQDRWKPLEQCTDSSCIADLAGALGVDFLLYTDAQDLGGDCVLTISIIEARTRRKVRGGIATGKVGGSCTPGRLYDALTERVGQVLGRARGELEAGRGAKPRAPAFREGAIGEDAGGAWTSSSTARSWAGRPWPVGKSSPGVTMSWWPTAATTTRAAASRSTPGNGSSSR